MNLIIDIGNTRTKLAVYKGEELITTDAGFDGETLIDEFIRRYPLTRAIQSSVGEAKAWTYSIPLLELTHETPLPFRLQYQSVDTLGRDRIALAAAAYRSYPAQDCLIIDAGTCITYDFLDRSGIYHGGGISPGAEMRLKSLNVFTRRLPLIHPRPDFPLIGDTTENSILSGTLGGMRREVQATIEAYQDEIPQLITIISGGDQALFEDLAKNSIFAPPEFLLSGLNFILEYNAERF